MPEYRLTKRIATTMVVTIKITEKLITYTHAVADASSGIFALAK